VPTLVRPTAASAPCRAGRPLAPATTQRTWTNTSHAMAVAAAAPAEGVAPTTPRRAQAYRLAARRVTTADLRAHTLNSRPGRQSGDPEGLWIGRTWSDEIAPPHSTWGVSLAMSPPRRDALRVTEEVVGSSFVLTLTRRRILLTMTIRALMLFAQEGADRAGLDRAPAPCSCLQGAPVGAPWCSLTVVQRARSPVALAGSPSGAVASGVRLPSPWTRKPLIACVAEPSA
jgi:hypothetical protein